MVDDSLWIEADAGLRQLLAVLQGRGYETVGLTEQDGCITLGPIASADDLPRGRIMDTGGGHVRCRDGESDRFFDKTLPMQGLKRFVYPAHEAVAQFDDDLTITTPEVEMRPTAVFGVRACDVAAIDIFDVVFRKPPYTDARFAARRDGLLIVAVDCAVPLETCFCASMGTGPHATTGFDLALTELSDGGEHGFLVRAGSAAGRGILAELDGEAVRDDQVAAKRAQADAAAAAMTRSMPANVASVVRQSHDSPHWSEVASRCLTCANCTMVCPTCFCSTVEDRNALDGTAWRERRWDSCFSIEFSYIHGGGVRESAPARYRQWMTHKLGHWHDQFGMSGCVGCGRCIAWCPVGIDITAEAHVLAADLERAVPTMGDN